jgi:hypothetical protein
MTLYPCWVIALEIGGMPSNIEYDSADTSPFQFTNVKLPSIPAGMDAGSIVLDWIEDSKNAASGFNFATGIRNPFPTGNSISIKIMDMTMTGLNNEYCLSRILARDNGDFFTGWKMDKTVLEPGEAFFNVTIDPDLGPPQVDRVYWIRNEAVKVLGTLNVGTSVTTYQINVQRGCLGSKARRHEVIPKLYAGDNGQEESLKLDNQPDFGTYSFDATIRYIRIDAAGVPTIKWSRHGRVEGKPTPGIDHWVFKISDLSKVMASHKVSPNAESISLSKNVRVIAFVDGQPNDKKIANKASLWLTRYEAEQLFNVCLHTEGNDLPESSYVTRLNNAIKYCADISYKVILESGGHSFLYHIANVEWNHVTVPSGRTKQLVKVSLSLMRNSAGKPIVSPGASISDSIVNLPNTGDGVSGAILNSGWFIHDGIDLPAGFDQPKVKLRIWMNCSPVKAILYFLLSDMGLGENDPDFDVLIGHRGLGLDPAKVNNGTTAVSALTIPEDTVELLKLDQLLPRKYDFRINDDTSFQEFASNIMRLHLLMMGSKPDTGGLTMRKWVRHINSSLVVLDPISDGGLGQMKFDQKLDRLAAIKFLSGMEELELKPEFSRMVKLAGTNLNDINAGLIQELRLWEHGNQLGDNKLENGIMHDVIYAFLTILRDEPTVYSVEMSVEDSNFPLMFGETVTWSDDIIPTKEAPGRGKTTQYIIVSIDVNLTAGIQTIKIIRDPINILVRSGSFVAPAVQALAIYSELYGPSETTFEIAVKTIGETIGSQPDSLLTAYGGIWERIANQNSRVRVIDFGKHNPQGFSYHKHGFRSYSAVLKGITVLPGYNNIIKLEFSQNYDFDGVPPSDLLDSIREGNVIIQLTDYSPETGNPDLVVISPITNELFANGNGESFAHVAPGTDVPAFDGTLYTIG